MSSFATFESFQEDFNASDYVAKLCSSIKEDNSKNAPNSKEFDYVPYIELFESNLSELKKFYLTIEKRVDRLTTSLETDQGEVHQKIALLGETFDEVIDDFTNLNVSAEKISGSALRIGKQLESIQNERNRAEEAREILGYFLELNNTSKCSKIDFYSSTGTFESHMKLADLLKKLNFIAKAEIPGSENASSIIRSKYSQFENEKLTVFMNAFNEEDIGAMKNASAILVTLNDASSCIKVFIERHAFFQEPYNCSVISKAFFSESNRVRLPINFSLSAQMDAGLISVFNLILKTVTADWQYLDEVFESPRSVMDTLLKRVFEEIIMRHVDEGLKFAGQHSTIQYLRYLESTYSGTLVFINDLLSMYREHMDDLPVTSINGAVEETRSFLLGLHNDIFGRYIRPTDTQILESRFIKEILDICSLPVQNFINAKKIVKASKNLFNLSTGTELKILDFSEIHQRCSFYLFRDSKYLVEMEDADNCIISSTTFVRFLSLISEAFSRMIIFYMDKAELNDLIENYFSFCIELLRKSCIAPIFSFNIENEDIGLASKPIDPKNFVLIQNLNIILSSFQIFFEDQLVPIMSSSSLSSGCSRKLYEVKNGFFDACLRYINKLIRLEVNGISTQLNIIAQKYIKKSDYRPKLDDLAAFNSCTQFCSVVREYLRSCARVMSEHLSQANATKILIQIGKIFFEQLVEHIKKLSFNDMGAIVLLNDINAYTTMLNDFGPDARKVLLPYFDFFREVSNLLMVKPENLRSVLQEGTMNLIDVRLFYQFIQLRSDFKTNNIDSLFPDIGNSMTSSNSLSFF